jgi:nucleoside-diphosphate-sugar epimerase
VLAGERGRPGQRYLLSGENITADKLVDAVAAISGVRGPRFTAPAFLVKGLVTALGLFGSVRGKQPPITNDVLQILGRHAWYNTTKARTELGWTSRSLHETLTDTIGWLRAPTMVAGAGSART